VSAESVPVMVLRTSLMAWNIDQIPLMIPREEYLVMS
jgi:hypothetical protein